ncbi:c-type cytochrome [Cognaticolwellia mytili]|uniref:c-type cytochrome n=1 Tax=Cognaticolwellia mytili TaxID=1888913 RepID=UPI001F2899AC|nr:cytochrome c [Cognaticolwellia mytili]
MTIVKQTLITMLGTILVLNCSFSLKAAELTSDRETQLIHMVKQDCGSCHGMTLKGGLGPTLLPKAMNKLPLAAIKNTILFGRPGTAMPEWKSILTEQEALWISQQLQQGIESHDQSK